MRLLAPVVSRVLRVRSGWAGAVCLDLVVEDCRSRCQDPDSPWDRPRDRSTGKNNKGQARNTQGHSRRHKDIPTPNPNTATQSQIPSPNPIRYRTLGPNPFLPNRNRRDLC